MVKKTLALVDDLFFSEKIGATAAGCGTRIEFVKDYQSLLEAARRSEVGLVIVDLNGSATQPLNAIKALKSDAELRTIPLLAYLSHVQTDLHAAAVSAGCDRVLPRSAFSRDLARILKEHS